MSLAQPDRKRRLLPRWQSSIVAISHGELASSRALPPQVLKDEHFADRLAEWKNVRSLEIAAELVGSAIVLGRTMEVHEAARFITDQNSEVSSSLIVMARVALGAEPTPAQSHRPQRRGRIDHSRVYHSISQLRAALRRHPRDVLGWVDLARLYTMLGQIEPARRAMRTALALAGDDRFVLRCAARFFVHVGEQDQALALLRRARATRHDPWLMAAEIAVSQIEGGSSRTAVGAAKALDAKMWSPHSRAELQGALATQLLHDGDVRRARKMFGQSLQDPTENAVAQAQWAVEKDTGIVIPDSALRVPQIFEAKALRGRLLQQWENVINDCWDWADYEPTSSRPMNLGSYVAIVALGDATAGLEFTERGLSAEPNNASMQNNKVVALAYLGRIVEATAELSKIGTAEGSELPRSVLHATAGLVLFRSGDVEAGRISYEQALHFPEARQDRQLQALARWHLALEEAVANTSEASVAFKVAEEASKQVRLPEIPQLRQRVADQMKRNVKS